MFTKQTIKRMISITMVFLIIASVMASCSDTESSVSDAQSLLSNILNPTDSSSEEEPETVEETTDDNPNIESISYYDDEKITFTRTEETELSFDISSEDDFTADDFIVDVSDSTILKVKEKKVDTGFFTNKIVVKVKAIKAGKATLTLKTADESVSSDTVSFVVNSVKSITFRESSELELAKGKTKTVVAFAEPKGIKKDDIKVYSSKKSVLKIKSYSVKNSGGKTKIIISVYASEAGNAEIKIKSRKGSVSDYRDVYVYKKTTTSSAAPVSHEPIVYVTPTGNKYHTATCRFVDPGDASMTESEAIARGYEACKVCH